MVYYIRTLANMIIVQLHGNNEQDSLSKLYLCYNTAQSVPIGLIYLLGEPSHELRQDQERSLVLLDAVSES